MPRRKIFNPNVPSQYYPSNQERGDQSASMSAKGDNIIVFALSGGINRALAPNMIGDDDLRYAENFWYPRETQSPTTRPGTKKFSTTANLGRITAMHVYQKDATTNFIVFACLDSNSSPTDQELYYIKSGTTTAVALLDENNAAATVGSLVPPTFTTFNGRLVMASAGAYLRVWGGEEETLSGNPPVHVDAAKAVASVTFDYGNNGIGDPVPGHWVTVGNRTFTMYPTRIQPGEIAIGPAGARLTNSQIAANLAAAINSDSWDVVAEQDVATPQKVNVTARKTGVVGNDYALSAFSAPGYANAIVLVDFASGVDGPVLDSVNTYGAPRGGIVVRDKNRRLIVGGEPVALTSPTGVGLPDRLYFSAPANEWSFAVEPYGFGQYIDIGASEGNTLSAIAPFMDEVWIHKSGQNPEIYRMRIADPNPDTWDVLFRPFEGDNAAVNPQCAVGAADKHVMLDENYIGVYRGNSTYDEVSRSIDGNKVYDLIGDAVVASTAFIVKDPQNVALLIFPSRGNFCLVYHYGSQRWMSWKFAAHQFSCGAYHESLGCLLFGGDDGYVYRTDPTIATDDGVEFQSIIIGKSYGSENMTDHIVKQSIIDYQSKVAGNGYFDIVANRDESNPLPVYRFVFEDAEVAIDLYRPTEVIDDLDYPYTTITFGRAVSDTQAGGETIAPRLVVTKGSATINVVLLRTSRHGRANE